MNFYVKQFDIIFNCDYGTPGTFLGSDLLTFYSDGLSNYNDKCFFTNHDEFWFSKREAMTLPVPPTSANPPNPPITPRRRILLDSSGLTNLYLIGESSNSGSAGLLYSDYEYDGWTISNLTTFKSELCSLFKISPWESSLSNIVWEDNVNMFLFILHFNNSVTLYAPMFYEGNTSQADEVITI